MKNIFAHTASPDNAISYPEFLSLNEDAGKISLTIRGVQKIDPVKDYPLPGNMADIELSEEKLKALAVAILDRFKTNEGEGK